MTADPLTVLAVAFVAIVAALMAVGLWLASRRPKTREEQMSEEARIADRLIAREIEKQERGNE